MELETVGDLPLPAAADREGDPGASGKRKTRPRSTDGQTAGDTAQMSDLEARIDAAPDRWLKTAPSRTSLHVNDPFS